jgi:hypothetical protein
MDTECLDLAIQFVEVMGMPVLALLFGINLDVNSSFLADQNLAAIASNMNHLIYTAESMRNYTLPFAKRYFECLSKTMANPTVSTHTEIDLKSVQSLELRSVSFTYSTSGEESELKPTPISGEKKDPETSDSKSNPVEKEGDVLTASSAETKELKESAESDLNGCDQGEQRALCDFSFRFEVGKVYSIVGRNGSGKSTLTKILMKLYEPSTGSVLVNIKRSRRSQLTHGFKIFSWCRKSSLSCTISLFVTISDWDSPNYSSMIRRKSWSGRPRNSGSWNSPSWILYLEIKAIPRGFLGPQKRNGRKIFPVVSGNQLRWREPFAAVILRRFSFWMSLHLLLILSVNMLFLRD